MRNLFQNTFKSQGRAIDQNALHLPKTSITSIIEDNHIIEKFFMSIFSIHKLKMTSFTQNCSD